MSEAKSAGNSASGVNALLEHLRAGIETQLQTHRKDNERLRAELERCAQENARLRAELEEVRNTKRDLPAQDTSKSNSQDQQEPAVQPGVVERETVEREMVERETVPWQSYVELKKKYENYYKTSKSAFAAAEHYKVRYQNAKTLIKDWHEYAQKCEQRLKERRSKTDELSLQPRPRIPDFSSSRPSSAGLETRAAVAKSCLNIHWTPRAQIKSAEANVLGPNMVSDHFEDDDRQSVQGGVEEHAGPAELPAENDVPGSTQDSDELLDIATHRSSSAPPQSSCHEERKFRAKYADGTLSGPIHIKSEPPSSPPVELSAALPRGGETFDLDETGTPIVTPRQKQRQADFLRTQAASVSFPAHGSDHSRLSWHNLPSSRRHQRRAAYGDGIDPGHDRGPGLHDLSSKSEKLRPQHGQKRTASFELGEEIQERAEDGDSVSSHLTSGRARKKAKGNQRIDMLLESTTPAEKQLIPPITTWKAKQRLTPTVAMTPSAPTVKQEDRYPAETITHHLPTPTTDRPQKSSVQLPVTATSKFSTPSGRSPRQSTRLRDRPLAELTPENFKLNTRATGGLTFATADPIRNRDDRRTHMQGCTDPACPRCSTDLRAFAAELDVTVGSTLFASTQDDRLTDTERLFQHYLGDGWREHLRGKSAEQREQIREKAKLKIIADRVGIHRIRPNERAKSPPGFWDVEMPTTQDMEMRAEEARKRQALIVAERYREAMRGPAGRWKFKDE